MVATRGGGERDLVVGGDRVSGAFQTGGGDAQPEGGVEVVAEVFGQQVDVVREGAGRLQGLQPAGDAPLGPPGDFGKPRV